MLNIDLQTEWNIDQQTEGENVEYRSTNRRESVEYRSTNRRGEC